MPARFRDASLLVYEVYHDAAVRRRLDRMFAQLGTILVLDVSASINVHV